MRPANINLIRGDAEYNDGEACPEYDAVSQSNTATTSSSVHWSSPFGDPPPPLNVPRRNAAPYERYLYTYNILADLTPLQLCILVEPSSGRPTPGKYTFRLSMKTNGIERALGESLTRQLSVDPRRLEFVVFVFPGKSSVPPKCLYSLRVWVRVNGVEHRLFGVDDLWVGKDPDFHSMADASFARLKATNSNSQHYHAFIGKALVTFIFKWRLVSPGLYIYSLDYEASGIGANLFDDMRLRIDGDPRKVTFLIYSVPMNSKPIGAAHRIRVWLRSLVALPSNPTSTYILPFNDSYIYQRIWKTDDFKVGSNLDFESLGNQVTMGFPSGGPQILTMDHPPLVHADNKSRQNYTF